MRKLSMLLGFLVAVIAFAGCGEGEAAPTGTGDAANAKAAVARRTEEKRSAIPVEAQLPLRGSISEYFDTTSRVEAERNVQVTSEGVGKCQRVLVDEGDLVNQGDLLAELDPSELNTQITSATSQLAKASSDYNRSREMFEEGLGPKVDYENARYAYEQQEASLNQLKVQLDNLSVRAPLTGIVTKKMVQEGQIVSSGSPIFEIVDPKSYIININAPEKDYLSRIKVGQKATVKLDSLDEEISAKVRKISPAVDEKTGTVKVMLDFEKSALDKLRDKAFAKVLLVLSTREDTLLLPKDVVMEENARKYVYVIERTPEAVEGAASSAPPGALVANRIEIKTGLADSQHVEVVEGLTDNSLVVTVGQQTLKSGSEVKLTTTQDELLAKAGLSAEEALNAAKTEHEASATNTPGQ